MDARYRLNDPSAIYSPALLFYKELIESNIHRMLAFAGRPDRLRPHAKTHKTREIIRLLLQNGITKHKCATIAEADVLAECWAADVLIAYPIVGPNCQRLVQLVQMHPQTRFGVLVDHADGMAQVADAFRNAAAGVDVLIDVNVGQDRTGIPPGERALALYESIEQHPGLFPGGIHAYDGHNHQPSKEDREMAVRSGFDEVLQLREQILRKGLPVPRFVVGGTPTLPMHVQRELPELECSPGTCVLHDHGYSTKFPDLGLTPAALLLTRVISRPTPSRVTFDLGTKAVASDPPAGQRLVILDLPDAKAVLHNEEHLVMETPEADKHRIGDVAYAMPTHVCPTCALHRFAHVVADGMVVDQWEIVARDRFVRV